MVKLDIFSDPVCPWCYIGRAELMAALETRPDHPFDIEWHPFQLNPDLPREGMDRREYLQAKFGPPEQVVQIMMPVMQRAQALGLEIDHSLITRTPNTLDAHRVIHWAGLEGRQSAMVARLMRGYFAEGADIGDAATLARLAVDAGVQAPVTRMLAGDADRAEIAARDRHARARGIQGVPCFIVAQSHVLTGAQPAQLWRDVIDEIAGLS